MKKQSLKISGGFLRNRNILFKDDPALRPTAIKIRQAVFNSLGNDLRGKIVLDLCSGSGINSFEAFSRGADKIVLVEKNRLLQRYYQDNIFTLKLDKSKIMMFFDDVLRFLDKTELQFDLIYFDPPFKKDRKSNKVDLLYTEVIKKIYNRSILKDNGIIVIEFFYKFQPTLPENMFEIVAKKKYGSIGILFLKSFS